MNYIVFDTETTGDIDNPLMYDLGYAVINDKGEILKTESLVIAEVFLDKELMTSAYFAEKIPSYEKALKDGSRKMVRIATAKRMLADDCITYNVHFLSAHNARFDYKSTATTQRYMTSSKYRYFLPFGTELIDTLKMARKVFKNDKKYGEFCYNNGYLTSRNCRKYTAEIIYRYLTQNNDFEEEHQGLDDVLIEKDILLYCLKFLSIEEGLLWEKSDEQ
jgi:DNA polymerase III, alpha subunit (gram-positive type)